MSKQIKLYQMMLNCEDWRSSSKVAEMSLPARAAYIDLLCVAWLTDDCTLPDDDRKLRMLARVPTEELWGKVWAELKPLYKSRGGRLYNQRQLDEYEKAKKIYKLRSKSGSKGGSKSASKSASKTQSKSGSKQPSPEQPTYNLQPTEETRDTTYSKPTAIGDLTGASFGTIHGSIQDLKAMCGEVGWSKSELLLRWMHSNYPGIHDDMDYVRNGTDPRIAESKGVTRTENPTGFLIHKCKQWSDETGIKIPSPYKLDRMNLTD